jgi:hypothetical protein
MHKSYAHNNSKQFLGDLVVLGPKNPFTEPPRPRPRPEVKKFIVKPMILKPTKKADIDSCDLLTCDFGAVGKN